MSETQGEQGEQSILHVVIPRPKKGAYVKASRARGMKLMNWVVESLDRAAEEDIDRMDGIREDWDNRFNR